MSNQMDGRPYRPLPKPLYRGSAIHTINEALSLLKEAQGVRPGRASAKAKA